MTNIVWRNLALVPEAEFSAVSQAYDETGTLRQTPESNDDTIFVYMSSGSIIEVHPATNIRLTQDFLEILDHQRLVAAYPRERVLLASFGQAQHSPFEEAS